MARRPAYRRIGHDITEPGDAYTVEEFCQRHRISVGFYHKLRKDRRGPREMRLGTRVLISREAAEEWRRKMSEQAEATP
jgi:hypothetical protein